MSTLELNFLGDFAVLRDGQPLPLPPSRKTRALLAFLCLNGRRFSREYLCELLWEVPDDPRGSLRWSLSKLRRLVDDEARKRVVADRTFVSIDTGDLSIDVTALRALVGNGLDEAPVAALERAAGRYRGNFLEGLEFSKFHDFHGWCVAEREHALRDRAALLTALLDRLASTPEAALPHARTLVELRPYDENARAALIGLLRASSQDREAAEQYQLGLRMLQEAGLEPTGALRAAKRAPVVPASTANSAAAPRTFTARTHAAARPLLGREDETSQLATALAAVVETAHACVFLIHGAPGIGKSRVLGSLLETAGQYNALVLRAAAFESDALRPFALWTDALRALKSDDYAQVFGATDVVNRDLLFGGLSDFVARQAATRPVVLLFDDIHWSDESSGAALHYLVRMNRERPVFGVCAARDEELRDNTPMQQALRGLRRDGLLREIDLGPLPEASLRQLIADQAPHADADRLSGACGGNPLLAIELARAESEGSGGTSLVELVGERLARFGTASAEVARWASILVPPFDLSVLATVTGLDAAAIGEALAVAEANAMLVRVDQGLRFSHDLIGKAVYNEISPLRREVMHRHVAEALVDDFGRDLAKASRLAHHATLSGDAALAAKAMVAAGRLSLRFFANDDALSLAAKGLQFAAELSESARIPLEIDLQQILFSAAPLEDPDAAAELYAGLAERALDLGDVAHARLGYHLAATVRWSQGDWDSARKQTLQSARVVRGGESKAHIVGMAETAKCLAMLERDLAEADAMLMEARARAQRKQFVHPAIGAGMGMLRLHADRLDEAEEWFQESRTLCKSAGDRLNEFLAAEYLVVIALQGDRLAEARRRAERLVDLGEKIREGSEKPFAQALLGLCQYAMDDEAEPLAHALADLRNVDAKYRLAYVLTRASLIDCERGRTTIALARAGEALEYAKILERPTEMLLAHAVLACACSAEDADAAASHLAVVEKLKPAAATWAGAIIARLAGSH